MSLIYAYKSRDLTRNIVIQDASGTTIIPDAADTLRAVIARNGQATVFEVTSAGATSNGSTFTKDTSAGTNVLNIVAADLAFTPGTYTLYIDLKDGGVWKNVDRQVFRLESEPTISG